MKNKQSQLNLSINVIIVIIVLFIIGLFIGILDLSYFDTFNPEEDVCEEFECASYNVDGFFNRKPINANCIEYFNQSHLEIYGNEICLSWRPKNKCELNPNNPECICDEKEKYISYETDECPYYEYYTSNSYDEHIEKAEKEYNCSIYKREKYSGNCLKSHLPVCKEVCE